MRLRTRLYLLVAGTVVPLVMLALVLGALLVDHERDNFRRLAIDRNRAFMSGVDAKLRGHISTLQALGANLNLAAGDLRAFHAQVALTLKTQPDWDNVILSDPGGRELLVGLRPYGDNLPEDPDPTSLQQAVDTRGPAIGNIRRWLSTGRNAVPVRVPIEDGPRLARVPRQGGRCARRLVPRPHRRWHRYLHRARDLALEPLEPGLRGAERACARLGLAVRRRSRPWAPAHARRRARLRVVAEPAHHASDRGARESRATARLRFAHRRVARG